MVHFCGRKRVLALGLRCDFSTFIDLCCNLFLKYLILRSYEFSLVDSSGEERIGEDHDADRYGLS